MSEFFHAVRDYSFMRYALAGGILASVACGIVGTYVVVRRITFIAGSIAHFVLGGMGAAMYLQRARGWSFMDPLYGAAFAALLGSTIIGLVSLKAREREDTVIGALWAIGMAVGVLFISRTPGYNTDLMSILFGNILMISRGNLWLMGGLDALVAAVVLLFHKQLLAVCFDEEFARLRGLRVGSYYLLLLWLTALTVVLLISIVGIVLVIALLTLPVAVAGHFSRSLGQMMILSILFSVAFTVAGLAVSFGPDLPAGATIVVIAGGAYLAAAAGRAILHRRRG